MSLRSGFESTHKHICFSSPKIAFYQAVFPSTSPESTRFFPSHTFSCKEITSDKRMSPRFHILSPSCKRLPGERHGMVWDMLRPIHTIPRALAVWRHDAAAHSDDASGEPSSCLDPIEMPWKAAYCWKQHFYCWINRFFFAS